MPVVSNRRGFSSMVVAGYLGAGILRTTAFAAGGTSDPLGSEQLFARSGNDDLDRALIAELKRIVRILEVNPGFKYYNEMNAYSLQKVIVEGTSDGTVVLGLPLIQRLMQEDDGGASVAGVCAHQCGHILQLKRGLERKLQPDRAVMHLELHADFIAGYYMGRRAAFTLDTIKQVSKAMSLMGDYHIASPDHHGTPEQRAASLEKGYEIAMAGKALSDALDVGVSYVLSVPMPKGG